MPVYNGQDYISRAIESVLAQTYKNMEIIVVDDGSTDKTAQIVKKYTDPRIRYIYQQNQWLGAARNTGINCSNGEFICFLDADDYFMVEKTERQIGLFESDTQLDAVYCPPLHFYTGRPKTLLIKKKPVDCSARPFEVLLEGSFINPNTLMVRRKVFDNIRFYSGRERYPEDWEFVLQLALKGFKFGYIDEPLVVVETRTDSLSSLQNQWIYKEKTVEMFENISREMSPEQKACVCIEKLLRKYRIQSATAYLAAGRKKEFFELIKLCLPGWQVAPAQMLRLIPAKVISMLLLRLWDIKQRLSLKRYRNAAKKIK